MVYIFCQNKVYYINIVNKSLIFDSVEEKNFGSALLKFFRPPSLPPKIPHNVLKDICIDISENAFFVIDGIWIRDVKKSRKGTEPLALSFIESAKHYSGSLFSVKEGNSSFSLSFIRTVTADDISAALSLSGFFRGCESKEINKKYDVFLDIFHSLGSDIDASLAVKKIERSCDSGK